MFQTLYDYGQTLVKYEAVKLELERRNGLEQKLVEGPDFFGQELVNSNAVLQVV